MEQLKLDKALGRIFNSKSFMSSFSEFFCFFFFFCDFTHFLLSLPWTFKCGKLSKNPIKTGKKMNEKTIPLKCSGSMNLRNSENSQSLLIKKSKI